jgi:hypothetical protein
MGSEESPADISAMQQELDELRERNRELESEGGSGGRHHTMGSIAHSTLVVFLLVLGTLCITLAPVTIWGRNLVLNTDRYVAILKPVASNPGVQSLVINAIDKQAEANIDISSIVSQTLPPKAAVLEAPLQSAVNGLVNVVATRFVQSPAFETLWVQINRLAHTQIVYLLTGQNSNNTALSLRSSGEIVLNLAPVMQQVKTQLVSAGLTVAEHIPVVGATIVIGQAKGLASARRAVRALNTAADVLPWLGLLSFAGAILAARRRRRMLIVSSLCTAGGMIFIGAALLIARHIYLNEIPTSQLPRDTAQYLFDTLVRYLREGIRIVLAIALLIAFFAWAFGPARYAVSLRHHTASAWRSTAAAIEGGPVERFVTEHTNACRAAIIGVALIILLFFTTPSWLGFIILAIIAALLLFAVEGIRDKKQSTPSQADAT